MTARRAIAVVGSRHLTDYRRFCTTIRQLRILRPDSIIVSGGADGIDSLAARFAHQNGYELTVYEPDQSLIEQKLSEGLDRRAAFAFAAQARNTQIVDRSYMMVAIACDHAKGTYDSIRKMKVKIEGDRTPTREGSQTIRLYHYIWECGKAW